MKRIDLSTRTTLVRSVTELTLIVVGILIALGIDSAITERQERALGRQSLELIAEDLKVLVEQLEDFQFYNRDILEASSNVEAALARNAPIPRTVELWDDLTRISGRRTLRAPRAAWEELVGTGNLRLLADPELRRDLVRFYETLARDEQIIARNNEVFADGLGVSILLGEGMVLAHPPPLEVGADVAHLRTAAEQMVEAGIPYGPTFDGRIWETEPGDPLRIRARSVAIATAVAAANVSAVSDDILTQAEALLRRIETSLAK